MADDAVSKYDLDALNARFEHCEAPEIIKWAVDEFGDDLAMSTSFGTDSAVMLHLATRVKPDVKVIHVDTGFLFAETVEFREELVRRLNLNLIVYRSGTERGCGGCYLGRDASGAGVCLTAVYPTHRF